MRHLLKRHENLFYGTVIVGGLALVSAWAVFNMVFFNYHHIRMVAAEDDCRPFTYAVTRLPLVGLVCILEPVNRGY